MGTTQQGLSVDFRGTHLKEVNSGDLAACCQREGKLLTQCSCILRAKWLMCQSWLSESVTRGLHLNAARRRTGEKQPKTFDHLLCILEGQVRVEEDVENEKGGEDLSQTEGEKSVHKTFTKMEMLTRCQEGMCTMWEQEYSWYQGGQVQGYSQESAPLV